MQRWENKELNRETTATYIWVIYKAAFDASFSIKTEFYILQKKFL